MATGLNAMQSGDLTAARAAFTRVTKLAPQIAPGHAALGSVLLALNDLPAAARELETAHRLDPSDLATDLNLGRTELALNQPRQAVATFQLVLNAANPIAFSPDETIAYAAALAATNQLPQAMATLQQAVTDTPNNAPLADALGTAIAQSGDLQQSITPFTRAVNLDPTFTPAQLHLAAALLALNRPEDALPPATLAAQALPDDFLAQLQLGRALSGVHRDAEALDHLHRAAALATPQQPADARYSLALALQASGDPKSAIPLFASALSSPSLTTAIGPALTNYALAQVLTGDAAAAIPLYTQALAAGPDSATLREDFGAAYLQKAELDPAIAQFRAGLALEPQSAHLHYDLGLALKLQDNLTAAIPEFERAAELDPTLPDPAFTLGVIAMQQGRYSDAIANLRRATALQPENGDAWALLGGVLKDSGDAPAAIAALTRAIQLQPDQPSLHIQLAALEAQAGRTTDAAADRKIAADLSRAALLHQRAQFALKSGRALLQQGKLPEAILQLQNAAATDPTLAEPHTLLADAYTRQGKPAEAALERRQAQTLTHP
jgi:tetratricopeptide (TPR) repeat protein